MRRETVRRRYWQGHFSVLFVKAVVSGTFLPSLSLSQLLTVGSSGGATGLNALRPVNGLARGETARVEAATKSNGQAN